jgi:tetratricopeptide (TPR) repeat protein
MPARRAAKVKLAPSPASDTARRRRRLLPEDYLERAMAARTPKSRANWAQKGLSRRGHIDRTTKAMLLRQLYLAAYAQRQFERAHELASQAAELGVLADVMHQDAARAKQALDDVEGAVGHLRLAARVAPASRRAFHWWTLGSVLYLADRHDEAIAALQRAARWGTTDKPLYQGHLALAKCAAGKQVRGLDALIERLDACPAGQGYGRFVLGQLAYCRERFADARFYLESFVRRTSEQRHPTQIALEAEMSRARATLDAMKHAGPR